MSRTERPTEEVNPESLMTSIMILSGINPNERVRLKGIPRYALRGTTVGKEYRYRVTFEHSAMGDELTTYRYPADRNQARNQLTTAILRIHPLREDVARYTDLQSGTRTESLEGIAAQERIATFLSEAQADIATVNI